MRSLAKFLAYGGLFLVLLMLVVILVDDFFLFPVSPSQTRQSSALETRLAGARPDAVVPPIRSRPQTFAELGQELIDLKVELKKIDEGIDAAVNGTTVALSGADPARSEEGWARRFDHLYVRREQIMEQIHLLDQRRITMPVATLSFVVRSLDLTTPQPPPRDADKLVGLSEVAVEHHGFLSSLFIASSTDTTSPTRNADRTALEEQEKALRAAMSQILDGALGREGDSDTAPPGLSEENADWFQRLSEERNSILERLAQLVDPSSPTASEAAKPPGTSFDHAERGPQITGYPMIGADTLPLPRDEPEGFSVLTLPLTPPVIPVVPQEPEPTPPGSTMPSRPRQALGSDPQNADASRPAASPIVRIAPQPATPSLSGNGPPTVVNRPAITVMVPRPMESELKQKCRAVIWRVRLGETLSQEDRSFLRQTCAA